MPPQGKNRRQRLRPSPISLSIHISQASEETSDEEGKTNLAVKRTDGLLGTFSAGGIAFNLARLVQHLPSYGIFCVVLLIPNKLQTALIAGPRAPTTENQEDVGNLYLSLVDWQLTQSVFKQLLD
eukprot:scaffold4826_cov274-Chaetoceros_neogracile.AAC.33